MATEYNRIIYNVKRPSPKALLVSFPMYMFRLKTRKFEYGVDFFQKAVLMFKSRPGISNSTIAACLGLEEDLVNEVQGVLAYSGYLSPDGLLTPHGLEMRNNLDTIVVDKNKEELGYIFQFVDRDDYYPFYIKNLGEEPNLNSKQEIIDGTKGDGKDRTRVPFPLDFISDKKRNLPFPNERVIFDIISKSGKEGVFSEKLSVAELGRELSLSFVPEKPEPIIVQVCTYIYLPQKDDETYEPEWQVLDPFGNGNNSRLKFYLESFKDSTFKKEIARQFEGAETIEGKSFAEYTKFIEKQVEFIKEEDFGIEFGGLDSNLQQFLNSVIRNLFTLRQYKYHDFDSGDQFIISCQRALETVFLIDSERRSEYYDQMKTDYSTPLNGDKNTYCNKRRNALKDLLRNRLITMASPNRLLFLAKYVEPNRANSLKQYIYNLILTYYFDDKSPLFGLVNGKLDKLFDIADLRNEKGHGQTETSGEVSMITEAAAESCYSFIKEFFNKYMTVAL